MARLSEIVERVKSQDTITGAQAEEQIVLLGAIRDQLKLSNIQLYNINKTLIDTMSAERRNSDKMLLAFREAEMEKKNEQLRGTAANQNQEPQSGGFGLGDLIIPALLAWQTGLDDVIQALTVIPTTIKEISILIGGKLLDGFKAIKTLITSSLIVPLGNIIDTIRSGKFYSSMIDMLTSLKTVFNVYIFRPLENIVDTIRKIRIVGPIMDVLVKMSSAIGTFIIKPFEIAIDIVKNLKPFQAVSNIFTRLNTSFDELNKTLGKVDDTVKSASKIGLIFKPLIELFGSLSRFVGNITGVLPIGRLLSKLPIINVVFAVYDFMKGFLAGYNEEGLLTGIKEGIFEVVRGIITKPLDLIKDIMSWAADKLGFASFSDILDGFSFTNLFNESIVPAVNRFIGNFVTAAVGIIDGIKLLADGDYKGAIKSLLGTSLEFFTNQAKWLYDNFIKGPLSWFFGEDVIRATEQTMKDVLGGSVDFFTNFPKWLYDNTIGPALRMFDGLMTSNENGPNRGLEQSSFQVPDFISDFGNWFYKNTIGPVADMISNWIPEGGIIAQFEKLLGDNLRIFTDFAGWFHEKFTKPVIEFFNNETPAEMTKRIRQRGGTGRGDSSSINFLREKPRDDRSSSVTIGHVGNINNTTMGGSPSMSPSNVGVSTATPPSGYMLYDALGNPLN